MGEPAESCAGTTGAAAASGNPSLLEGAASGPLHGIGAGIRSLFSRGTGQAGDVDATKPHRPFKIIYATLYYDVRPTFVVDITEQFEARLESLMAYKTQFSDQEAGKGIFPARDEIRSRIEAMARFYGMLGGVTYAEPFLQKEVGLVEDLTLIPVKSI